MIDFSITEKDIAISRARWEPEFRMFAERTTAVLASTRKLPIYVHAIELAGEWLRSNVLGVTSFPPSRMLLLVGDEHLLAACRNVLDPVGLTYIHIFPEAWAHWHTTEFRGDPWWWNILSWTINDPARLIHFAEYDYPDPGLRPNERYLLSISGRPRNTDSICYLVDGKLVVDEPYCDWVVS